MHPAPAAADDIGDTLKQLDKAEGAYRPGDAGEVGREQRRADHDDAAVSQLATRAAHALPGHGKQVRESAGIRTRRL